MTLQHFSLLVACLTSLAFAGSTCCWSKWGDASTCGNYPQGQTGGVCNADFKTACSGNNDCASVPPAPAPQPGPAPPKPTKPTLCTTSNKGHCDCANLQSDFKGGNTYTWYIDNVQRCLTTYVPEALKSNTSLPTVMYFQCYAKDSLNGLPKDALHKADRFGMALAYLSSPWGAWSWNQSIVNDEHPLPCSEDTAGPDYTYVKESIEFINSQAVFDPSRLYTNGFSQNGMASSYTGMCFPSQITGTWIGGGGLFELGHGPVPPNRAGTCTNGCKYWPAYPCHSDTAKTSVQACIQFYTNDPITVDQQSSGKGHGYFMYDRLKAEGNDGRMLAFSPDSTQSITGGHSPPRNMWDWMVSCFGGISPPCSSKCESALSSCMQGIEAHGQPKFAAFDACVSGALVQAGVCQAGCTPSYKMLVLAENPVLNLTDGTEWGQPATPHSKPSTSICIAPHAALAFIV